MAHTVNFSCFSAKSLRRAANGFRSAYGPGGVGGAGVIYLLSRNRAAVLTIDHDLAMREGVAFAAGFAMGLKAAAARSTTKRRVK